MHSPGHYVVPKSKGEDETRHRGAQERRRECEDSNKQQNLHGERQRHEHAQEEGWLEGARRFREPSLSWKKYLNTAIFIFILRLNRENQRNQVIINN